MALDSKRTVSLESVSTCGTNNSAFFCESIDSHEMKYSMSDESSEISGLVSTLSRSNEDNIVANKKSELSLASSFRESFSTYPNNIPNNVDSIFRHQTGPMRRSAKHSEISKANPLVSSNSDGTGQPNNAAPRFEQNHSKNNADKHLVITKKSWSSRSENNVLTRSISFNESSTTSCQISVRGGPNKNSEIAGATYCSHSYSSNGQEGNRVLATNQDDSVVSEAKKFTRNDQILLQPQNNSHDHFLLHRSTEDAPATKTSTDLMQRIEDSVVSVSSITKSMSSQTEDTENVPLQSLREESHSVKTHFRNIINLTLDKMKAQKDNMTEQYQRLAANLIDFSSYIASCCSTNISSAIVATHQMTQQNPTVSKVSKCSSSVDEFVLIEQMTRDVGIEVSDLYSFLKDHYFDYPMCSEHMQLQSHDDSITIVDDSQEVHTNSCSTTYQKGCNLENRINTAESTNLSTIQFISEIDSCAAKLGLTRKDFMHRVTSMMKTNVLHHGNRNEGDEKFKSGNSLKNLRIVGALVKEDESVALKSDVNVSASAITFNPHSKFLKAHTRIGLRGKHVGVERRKKSSKFIQKGRFRLIS